jgi:hypothetical protein
MVFMGHKTSEYYLTNIFQKNISYDPFIQLNSHVISYLERHSSIFKSLEKTSIQPIKNKLYIVKPSIYTFTYYYD